MDNPRVIIGKTKFGKGLFAKKDIKKDELIAEFDGQIYFDADYDGLDKETEDHIVQFAKDKWRDSKGVARWINHSCEPNCGVKNLLQIVAMRDIEAGEELTWDYEMTEDSDWWQMECKCGTPSCRKIIGTYDNMPQEIRQKYNGYISEWLTNNDYDKEREQEIIPSSSQLSQSE